MDYCFSERLDFALHQTVNFIKYPNPGSIYMQLKSKTLSLCFDYNMKLANGVCKKCRIAGLFVKK